MYCLLRIVRYVLFSMYCVSRTVHYVLFSMYCVLRTVHYVLFSMYLDNSKVIIPLNIEDQCKAVVVSSLEIFTLLIFATE